MEHSVVAVDIAGTHLGRMAKRARATAEHLLVQLRLALTSLNRLSNRQLRFRLGVSFAFDERLTGFEQRDDVAYPLTLPKATLEQIASHPVWSIPEHPRVDLDKRAKIAMSWIDRSLAVSDPLTEMLFLFFALESLVGDKGEGLKADKIAFRLSLLSQIARGSFPHPNKAWVLYDQVRSAAVHGEPSPEITDRDVSGLAIDVRACLTDTLTLARVHGFGTRSKLMAYLEAHPDRELLVQWIRENAGAAWEAYLAPLAQPVRTTKIRRALCLAVHDVMTSDRALLRQHVGERSIMFQLGRHLAERLVLSHGLSIDLEYNRAARDIKRLQSDGIFARERARQSRTETDQLRPRNVLPDLIVHDRETGLNNVLAVEVKVNASKDAARLDVAKLASIRRQLGYEAAVFVDIRRDGRARWHWLTDETADNLIKNTWKVPLVAVE
jgi:hypothetical protein